MAIITISRGTFIGGVCVAESVSEKLGYRCIAREELIKSAARCYGLSEEKLTAAIDEPLTLSNKWNICQYITCLRATLFRELAQGNVVYHGHAGHLLLQGVPNLLNVRIIESKESRIRFLIEQKDLTLEESIQYIKYEDEQATKWTRFVYDVDWGDSSSYDLVINIGRIDVRDACELIINAAKLDKYKDTPETRKILNNLILAYPRSMAFCS